jgi:hypothetical protein
MVKMELDYMDLFKDLKMNDYDKVYLFGCVPSGHAALGALRRDGLGLVWQTLLCAACHYGCGVVLISCFQGAYLMLDSFQRHDSW